jgi:hypothetical protein
MGEWKASVTMRIRSELREQLSEFAAREKRSLGNVGALLLEWAFEQLKAAGSTERLLKYRIRPLGRQGKGS